MQNPKAIIYARVSTKRQEREGISIPGQISRGEAHLLASGYQVAAIYKEAHSASEKASKRPEFLKAVSHALDKKAGISALWVYDTDRFSRDRIEGPLYKAQLRASGVEIIYHAYQVNPKDINDRLMGPTKPLSRDFWQPGECTIVPPKAASREAQPPSATCGGKTHPEDRPWY